MKLSDLPKEDQNRIFTKKPNKEILDYQKKLVQGILEDTESLKHFAIKYELFPCENYPTNIGHRIIFLEKRKGFTGIKWVIKMDSWVLSKDLHFDYEPIPSNRNEQFIENTRFASKKEALSALLKHIENLNGEQAVLTIKDV